MNSSARSRDAIVALEEALAGFRAAGDVLATADVLGTLSSTFRDIGDARGWTYPHEVVDLLEGLGPSWVLADALIRLGFVLSAEGRLEESLATLGRAETVAAGIADPRASDAMAFRGNLLAVRGLVGAMLGDERGLDEMEEAVRLSIASGNSIRAGHTSSNLGQQVAMWRGPRSGVEVLKKGLAFAAGRGLQAHVVYHRLCELFCAFDLGEHDAVLDEVPALERALESYGWASALVWLRSFVVGVATLRGKPVDAATLAWIEGAARESNEPDDLLGLAATVPAHLLRGERDAARTLLIELGPHMAAPYAWWWQAWEIASLVRASLELDELGLAESMVGGFHARIRTRSTRPSPRMPPSSRPAVTWPRPSQPTVMRPTDGRASRSSRSWRSPCWAREGASSRAVAPARRRSPSLGRGASSNDSRPHRPSPRSPSCQTAPRRPERDRVTSLARRAARRPRRAAP